MIIEGICIFLLLVYANIQILKQTLYPNLRTASDLGAYSDQILLVLFVIQ